MPIYFLNWVQETKVSEEKENLSGIEQLFLEFREYGYINDQQTVSGIILHHIDVHKKFSKLGYEGGKIICAGHTYPIHGAIYWIYDSSIISYEESRRLTDHFVEMQNI